MASPLANDPYPLYISAYPPNKPPPRSSEAPLLSHRGSNFTFLLVIIFVVLIGFGIFVFLFRRKKREEAESIGGGEEPKDGPNTGFPRQRSIPSPAEHKVTVLAVPVSPETGPNSEESPLVSGNAGSEKPVSSSPVRRSLGLSQSTFTYEELSKATDNFSKVNLLGQGGFGYVYQGVLSNGEAVAVKQLKFGSGQGEREFMAEIETTSRVHHRHLVSLVGYCITGDQRFLVYEFLPNNTLAFHLHGKQRPVMNWETRMKVARGSAKGLAYLHEDCQPKIIHRDIKAANILLDHSLEAKVADFGLAKYFSDTDTHVSTRVMGTFGYMAPEYASSGKLTEKSDVFSFGVVLLELVTGRLPVDRTPSSNYDCILDWARPLLQQALQFGIYDALVDPKLQNDYDSCEITRVIACAAACVNHSARHRPRMSQIVQALGGNMSLEDLNKGTASGYVRIHISYESSDYSSGQYKEDLVKFRKLALESQEQGSSEYSAYTSDFAMNSWSSSTEGQQTTEEMEKNVSLQRRPGNHARGEENVDFHESS